MFNKIYIFVSISKICFKYKSKDTGLMKWTDGQWIDQHTAYWNGLSFGYGYGCRLGQKMFGCWHWPLQQPVTKKNIKIR